MRNRPVLALLLFAATIGGIFFTMFNKMDSVKQIVEKHYTDTTGCIHAYPDDMDSPCLSESIGLYMEYLLQTNDEEGFDEQFYVLTEQFLRKKRGSFLIRWELKEDVSANALIDDTRIINALRVGGKQFNKPAYTTLANSLTTTLKALRQGDVYADYYNWQNKDIAPQITLSYITNEFAIMLPGTQKTVHILGGVNTEETFFPESYQLREKQYKKQKEIHMVDQLLIAINRNHAGYTSDRFNQWLKAQWDQGILYGRYDRSTLEPTVSYESLAVYYYLYRYFLQMHEDQLAIEVADHASELAKEHKLKETHFFDFIHYQQMKYETEGMQ